ncbi:MAG: hypothetical protein HQ518_18135 [Rhodopirellula sp.]|nr:hypothetical protein [Rhodopirellula sp.]
MTISRTTLPLFYLTFATAVCISASGNQSAFGENDEPVTPATSGTTKSNASHSKTGPKTDPKTEATVSSDVATQDADTDDTPSANVDAKPETVLLRYQFKKGQYVHYEENSRSEMTLVAREQTQSTRESRRTNKHFRIVSVDENGSAVVEPVIDRVQMEVRNDNDPPVKYDSSDNAPVSKDFEKVEETIGKPSLRIRYAASGKVEHLLPLETTTQAEQPAEEQEKQNFLIAFPEEAITIGEAWTDNYMIDVSVDGDLKNPLKKRVNIRRTYTLKELKDGIAHIHFRIYPLAVERDPQIQAQLIHHSRFGTIQFDTRQGVILEWQSSGSGHVFNAFGPSSSMKALSSTTERYISSPSAVKRQPPAPRRPAGPAGPQLPGISSL